MSIELKNVRFHYPKHPNDQVINISSWSVKSGEHVFIHGPSGGGKSTLLNLLSGILIPNKGEISILGQRIDGLSTRQRDKFRASHIGYVFQQFNLIPYLSAIDNVLLASQFAQQFQTSNTKQSTEQLLQALNISPAHWHKPTRQLSIGQQQRIAISRALINKPQILIADEPTSSLDSKNRDDFMALLISMAKENNMTLVLVSHDLTLSHYFDRTISLSDINQIERA